MNEAREANIAEETAIKQSALKAANAGDEEESNIMNEIGKSFRMFSQRIFAEPAAPVTTTSETIEEEPSGGTPAEAAAPAGDPEIEVPAPAAADTESHYLEGLAKSQPSADAPAKTEAPAAAPRRRSSVSAVAVGAAGAVVKAPVKGVRRISKLMSEGADALIEEFDAFVEAPPSGPKAEKKAEKKKGKKAKA